MESELQTPVKDNEKESCINEGLRGRALALKLPDESLYSQRVRKFSSVPFGSPSWQRETIAPSKMFLLLFSY